MPKEMTTHSSILTWEILAGCSLWGHKSQTQLHMHTHTHPFTHKPVLHTDTRVTHRETCYTHTHVTQTYRHTQAHTHLSHIHTSLHTHTPVKHAPQKQISERKKSKEKF